VQGVNLTWRGVLTSSADIYRNGVRLTTVSNTLSYTDNLKGGGTYVYRVCEAGSTTRCSDNATVSF
jgi:hypothetical protein